MSSDAPPIWLHRLGYAAMAIVALEIVGLGCFALLHGGNGRLGKPAPRNETGLQEGPIGAGLIVTDASRLLNTMPALENVGPDAIRFVAMPSFGTRWFGLVVRAERHSAMGLLLSVERSGEDNLGARKRISFRMPLAAYRKMTARFDRATSGMAELSRRNGSMVMVEVDGTPVVFERMRSGHVRSGVGNASSGYSQLASILHDGLKPFVKQVEDLSPDWTDPWDAVKWNNYVPESP